MYKSNDVCVVGRGSVFSGTWNFDEFMKGLFDGQCYITDLRTHKRASFPWDVGLVYSADRKAEDQTYSPYGAHIDRVALEEKVRASGGNWSELTSIEAVGIEAMREALEPVKHLPQLKNAELIIGLSTVDTESTFKITDELLSAIDAGISSRDFPQSEADHLREVYRKSFVEWEHRKPQMSYVVASSLTDRLKQTFGIVGPASLIDAACASSLAALHIAIKKLRQGESDMIISGGVDVSVSSGCLVFFSRLGAMSPEINLPFDQAAGGLTQGEGAGLFVLMRLEDAVKNGLKIYGVLKACEGSSDGRSSAIVEPTVEGQLMAYQRTHADAGISEVHYIEAHGTGTQVGDRTEVESLTRQFPKMKIPIGTVKANIGHTIAAAGAAGLMKSLGVIERRSVPGSPHFKKFPRDFKTQLYVSPKTIPLETNGQPITIAQSSFGFGGSNFHLVVQEYSKKEQVRADLEAPPASIVVCGSRSYSFSELEEFSKSSQFKFPPNIIPQIEKVQLLGLALVERTFAELGIFPEYLDRDRVSVISSTMIPLKGYWTAGRRVISSALRRFAQAELKDEKALHLIGEVFEDVERGSSRITEDTLSGFLNNIVAGRICNAYDFKGVSFNIDSDTASRAAAIRTAQSLLETQHGMVVLIFANEEVREDEQRIDRTKLECMVLANATYSLEYDLPMTHILNSVSYREAPAGEVRV